MVFLLIGVVVGIIMGLTGAGGALISIPLFVVLVHTSLKEATALSLVAVVFGTSMNLIGQFKNVDWKIVLPLVFFGISSNFIFLKFKGNTPDLIIVLILSLVTFYSLWSVWKKKSQLDTQTVNKNVLIKSIMSGIVLGLLTSLTGLGGGVVLVPILISFFGKSYNEALPNSLTTILLVSTSSLLMQSREIMKIVEVEQLLFLGLGAFVSYVLLKTGLKKLEDKTILSLRKIIFTIVAIYSVSTIVYKVL